MSRGHSYRRASAFRHNKLGEATIFIAELALLAAVAGITYLVRSMTFFGAPFFGMGGIVLGLIFASGGGAVYTANNKKQMFHVLGFIMILLYLLGLAVNYFYPAGSWLVVLTEVHSIVGWIVGFIVGLFVFLLLVLSMIDAKSQNME